MSHVVGVPVCLFELYVWNPFIYFNVISSFLLLLLFLPLSIWKGVSSLLVNTFSTYFDFYIKETNNNNKNFVLHVTRVTKQLQITFNIPFILLFSLGNKSCSGSVQSLSSADTKDTPKALSNPDLPPKVCRRARLDTASSNGYQRPGSV